MDDPDLRLLLGIIILIVFGVVGWTYREQLFGEPQTEPVPVTETAAPTDQTETTEPAGPLHPLPELSDHALTGELVELPPLDDSDSHFLLDVATNFGPTIEALLARESIIDRLVATVDNLPRGKLADNIRPVGQLQDAFATDADGGALVLGPSSYARYDALVATLFYANLDSVYDMYRRFYPLFQRAYEQLGYPDAYFNDRLVEVIDHLIAAPSPDGPVLLVRPNVLYEFADPDLEALSSGQKLMLRMGPDNAATVRRMLQEFRSLLVATD